MHATLEHLTDGDWSLLLQRAERRAFQRDETILRQGEARIALHVVRRGFARVERDEQGSGIAIARLGPGELFGEMSLLESGGASASVVADEAMEIDVIDGAFVQSLLMSDPGLSTRFYRSLAVSLSRRLRATSTQLAQVRAHDVPLPERRPAPRTGHLQARQIPADLSAALRAFEETMASAKTQDAVSGACDALLAALGRHIDPEALVLAGLEDPFGFRDPSSLEAGFGAHVFRETFPIFMASATLARCYTKPRGYADDWETLERIHRDEPEGDGRLGPLVDRWFLSRPICRTRRNSRDWMTALLSAVARAAQESGHSLAVTSLASRAAPELFDAMAEPVGAMSATCVDGDPEALRAAAEHARRRGVESSASFVTANVLRVARGEATLSLPPQGLVYALGLWEYVEDDDVVRTLDWAHGALEPGGLFVATNLAAGGADALFMEHVLEWRVTGRTEAQLRDLVGRSRFGRGESAQETEVMPDAEGGTLFVRCVR